MKQVLRNENGTIEKVRVANDIYLTPSDAELFYSYVITEEETAAFFGEDNLIENLQRIANNDYDTDTLRYDILRYNEVFKNI